MSPAFNPNSETPGVRPGFHPRVVFYPRQRVRGGVSSSVSSSVFSFKSSLLLAGWLSLLALAVSFPLPVFSSRTLAQDAPSLLLTQEQVLKLAGKVSAVAINADETIIASAMNPAGGGGNGRWRVVLTDRPSMGRLGMIDAQVGERPRLRFSPVADLLLIGGSEALELWSLPISPMDPKVPLGKNQRRWRVEFPGNDGPGGAAFGTPPSQVYWIAAGALHGKGVIIGGAGEDRPVWKPRSGTLRQFAFHPGLQRAVMVLEGRKELSLVNLGSDRTPQTLKGHRFEAIGARFGNSGAILSLDRGNNLMLWNEGGGLAESRFIKDIPKTFSIDSFTRLGPGHLLLTGGQGGAILTPIDRPAAAGRVTADGPEGIAVSPTGRYLAAARGNTVRLYGFSRPLHPMAYVRRLRARKAFQTAQSYVRLMDSRNISPQLKSDLLNAVGQEPRGKSLQTALARMRLAVEQGNADRIRRAVKRIFRLQPDHPEAAAALRHLRDLEEAQVFQRAREAISKGENKIAISLLASGIEEKSRRYPEAMQLIREAEAKRSVQIMMRQAREKIIMGQYPAADVLVKEALQQEPRNPAALAMRKEIDERTSGVFDSLIVLLAVIFAGVGLLAFLVLRYRGRLLPYLNKLRLDEEQRPATGTRNGNARDNSVRAAWARKAAEENTRTPPKRSTEKSGARKATRRQVVGKLRESIEAKIHRARLADPQQQHTALLMGIEAEMQSVHRQLDDPASDLGSIHNRLKAIAAQLNALRFSEPRKHPKKDGKLTLYDLLKLHPGATQGEIKAAYHALIKQYHPDVHNESQFEWVRTESERMSRRISEAYDVLGNEERRARYDRELQKSQEGTHA